VKGMTENVDRGVFPGNQGPIHPDKFGRVHTARG
jgi:hypothetical protein